jgi:3',5'-cyclic-nucleotide phosphodiesterase
LHRRTVLVALALLAVVGCAGVQETRDPGYSDARFISIVLGTAGGLSEGNLSAYLLAPVGSTDFICLDAGTIHDGILKAHAKGSFFDLDIPTGMSPAGVILREHVKAYVISHAHLDHVAGMILNSTDDGGKPVYGLDTTIDAIRDHLFNWSVWPNFGTEGVPPHLGSERYVRVEPGREESVRGTGMTIEPFLLSHGRNPSTAFLIRSGRAYALYFGDAGPDVVEGSDGFKAVWARAAPLVRTGALRGIFLEVSYPNGRSDQELFGHLTPAWLMAELHELASTVSPRDPDRALRSLTVIVTHIKPSLDGGTRTRERIQEQLLHQNELGVRVLVPTQGERIEF